MAICYLSRDLLRTTSCGYSLPEIVDLYLANYDDVSATTAPIDSGDCQSLTNIGLVEGKKFYHIVPAKGTTSFSDTLVVGDNGNKYRTHSITFSLSNKYDECLHMDLDALSLGRYFCVVVSADGQWLALGREVGLEAETAELAGGQDSNGITVTLSANCAESALPLSDEAIDKVKGNS